MVAMAEVAHHAGIPLTLDNIFGMGGYLCRSISLGAEVVIHSRTNWIGGHGTSMDGIVIDGDHFDSSASGKFPGFTEPADSYHVMHFWETYNLTALAAKLSMDAMHDLGLCMSPFNACIFLQGLRPSPSAATATSKTRLSSAHSSKLTSASPESTTLAFPLASINT